MISFRSIARVSNLQGLTALTTLKLDNNLLTEMGCLEHMVRLLLPAQQVQILLTVQIARWLTLPPMQTSLTCLDLSFNCIATIPVGLDRLTRLVDLSLFANKICTLESMTALRGLEILSLGALLSC